MKLRPLPAILFLLAAGLLGAALSRPGADTPVEAERPAPDASLRDADLPGENLSAANLRDWGPAPELRSEVWINADAPLRLAGLGGKVVLLEMWTYGCYNCRNVLPSLKDWHARYSGQGLVIIGNHYPEFARERDLENLRQAVRELEIPYPVAQDNDGATWKAYGSRYWPTLYLIDRRGHIRYQHIGEGGYAQTEAAIQALLAEDIQ